MNMRPGGYSIPGGNNQNQYMQGAGAGNWGMINKSDLGVIIVSRLSDQTLSESLSL